MTLFTPLRPLPLLLITELGAVASAALLMLMGRCIG